MTEFSLHFSRIRELLSFERAIVRSSLLELAPLSPSFEVLYRYAIGLARIGRIRDSDGEDLLLSEELHPFRRWLKSAMLPAFSFRGEHVFFADGRLLIELAPEVALRTEAMRAALLSRHGSRLSAARLDDEVGRKVLGLVLGGGGGAGFAHLGAFQLLAELGLRPSYLIGTSLGSLVGLVRALKVDYDPTLTMLTMPRGFDVRDMLRPYGGRARFGFPGFFDLDVTPMASKVSHAFLGGTIPPFDELEVHFEVMATGVRAGFELSDKAFRPGLWGVFGDNPLARFMRTRQMLRTMVKLSRRLISQDELLREIVFNFTPGTEGMRIVDAIGFSCSVPGVLHYDVLQAPRRVQDQFQALFEKHDLSWFVDGGVVNNVPSRVAWNSIQRGSIGHRNAFILALDPFAPIPNSNALFMPLQQVTRPSMNANRPYADLTHILRAVPNPINLSPGLESLQRFAAAVHRELQVEAPFIQKMTEPLPSFSKWVLELSAELRP